MNGLDTGSRRHTGRPDMARCTSHQVLDKGDIAMGLLMGLVIGTCFGVILMGVIVGYHDQ